MKSTDEEAKLRNAFEYIAANLDSVTESILKDNSLSEDKRKAETRNRLIEIRDRVLRLKLIVVVLQNEEDAYLIFETLNTRGKDLTVSDLV